VAVWEAVWPVLAALIPSIGMLFLGWVILRHILEGDRRERAALREWEAEAARLRAARAGHEGHPGDASGVTPGRTPSRADDEGSAAS
jgi:hypothetical protein